MHSKIQTAIIFLEDFCKKNSVEFYSREPDLSGAKNKNVAIVGTKTGNKGSIGLDKKGEFKCYFLDPSRVRWARLEGFSEDDINTGLIKEVVREVSLRELASLFVKDKCTNF